MKICLVSLAIGEMYLKGYDAIFRPSHEAYARRHGYDFRVVSEYLDEDLLHKDLISFQKALVFSQAWSYDYDLIIFVDADIIINMNSPAIHTVCDPDRINMVNEFAQPTKELRRDLQQRSGWETTATEYYKLSGFNIETDIAPNTGVIVASPKLHGTYLRNIYEIYKEPAINHKRGYIYEQSAIGYCVVRDSKYAPLPNRWNGLWMVNNFINPSLDLIEFANATYFIHFAGYFDYEGAEKLSRSIHPASGPIPQ